MHLQQITATAHAGPLDIIFSFVDELHKTVALRRVNRDFNTCWIRSLMQAIDTTIDTLSHTYKHFGWKHTLCGLSLPFVRAISSTVLQPEWIVSLREESENDYTNTNTDSNSNSNSNSGSTSHEVEHESKDGFSGVSCEKAARAVSSIIADCPDNLLQQLTKHRQNLERLFLLEKDLEYVPKNDYQFKQETLPLLEAISLLPNLRLLVLSGLAFDTLPEAISHLPRLESLKITNSILIRLPESFGELTRLKRLSLESECCSKLPESFGNLSSLKHLELICDSMPDWPAPVDRLQQLEQLHLNLLIQRIPESIGSLTNLEELRISCKSLSHLPNALGQLTKLRILECQHAKLRSVPEVLFSALVNLQQLTLAHIACPLSVRVSSLLQLKKLHIGAQYLESVRASSNDMPTGLRELILT